ncbi:MAG TPA: hypothetical protein VK890_09335 [Bacteroidia bacterium]|jgi:hypothetical protein|nr:hypothetical protein [Bacteroidia bacterium]
MKTVNAIILAGSLFCISFSAMAQEKSTLDTKQLAQQQTDEVKKNVDKITPDQLSKILPVEQEFANGMRDARIKCNSDTVAMNRRALKLCKSRDTKIKTVLTTEQYSQYLDMEKGKGCKLNCTK